MKVAFITKSFPVSSETFVIQQIRFFVDRGDEVSILTLNSKSDELGRDYLNTGDLFNYVQVIGVNNAIGSWYKRAMMFCFRYVSNTLSNRYTKDTLKYVFGGVFWLPESLQKLVNQDRHLGDYDLLVCHFGEVGVFASQLLRSGLISGRLAIIFHGYDISKKSHIKKWSSFYLESFLDTSHIFPVSDLWKERLISLGAPPEKIITCHMGIDINEFSFRHVNIPAPASKEPMRILLVGRSVEKKGIMYAIEAAALCETPVHLDIVGAGPLFDGFVVEIDRLGLDCSVDMHGALSHGEIKVLLEQAHVFLLPSVDAEDGDMEGIPVSLMEAMASGVPVVSTFHSGIPELVTHEYSGLLCNQRSARELVAAIERIRCGEIDVHVMAANARKIIEEDFNSLVNNRKIVEIFEKN